jgi:hypothetical protein
MTRTVIAAFAGGIVGAAVGLLARNATTPTPLLPAVDAAAAFKSETNRLSDRLDEIARSVDLVCSVAQPARVEVDQTVPNEVSALLARVDSLETALSALTSRVDAMAQPRDAGSLNAWVKDAEWSTDPELKKRLEATDWKDANALSDLAVWASGQGRTTDAKRIFRLAVKADPENARAREGLGYKKYDGKWMTAREIERAKADGH